MQQTSEQEQNNKQNRKRGEIFMFQMLKKRIKNEKGLTLIELLAVIVILAIVAAIAVPAIGNIIDNSRYNAIKADGVNVLNAANLYFTDNPNATTVTVPALKQAKFLESSGKIPNETSSTVTKVGTDGLQLTATVPSAVKGYSVTFSNATLDTINNVDKQKGSNITSNYTVGTTQN